MRKWYTYKQQNIKKKMKKLMVTITFYVFTTVKFRNYISVEEYMTVLLWLLLLTAHYSILNSIKVIGISIVC